MAENEKKGSIFSRPIGGGKTKSAGAEKSKPAGGGKQTVKVGGKAARGKMPTKQSINLVIHEKKSVSPVKATVFAVIIIAAAVAFSKFMVIDRITAMSQATGEVARLRSSLAVTEESIASYGEIRDVYAHYTYTGMTSEELSRVDRAAVLEMADAAFASGKTATNWQLSGNTLTAEVVGRNLEELNELAQFMQSFPIVDRCAITNANKTTRDQGKAADVRATIIIYLTQPAEEEGGAQS